MWRTKKGDQKWGECKQIKISSEMAVVQTTLQKSHKWDALEPTGDWSLSDTPTEYSGTLTIAKTQEVEWNLPKPESEALNFNQNEARSQSKIT